MSFELGYSTQGRGSSSVEFQTLLEGTLHGREVIMALCWQNLLEISSTSRKTPRGGVSPKALHYKTMQGRRRCRGNCWPVGTADCHAVQELLPEKPPTYPCAVKACQASIQERGRKIFPSYKVSPEPSTDMA